MELVMPVFTAAIALIAIPDPVQAQRVDVDADLAVSEKDIIVTARRRPKPLDGAVAIDDQSAGRLSTYGARTVNEVIERLRTQQGGRPFSIVVNGRRIGSISDIGDLPAEALESTQIYSPATASKFGFASTEQLLNLQLKQQFRSLSLDAEGSGSTDDGAESISLVSRGARLNGDERFNGTVTTITNAGILEREHRFGTSLFEQGSADARSLVPRTRSIATSLGGSRPLRTGTLDVNIRGNRSQSTAQTGFDSLAQIDNQQSMGVSTTYNMPVARIFWSVSADANASSAHSVVKRRHSCAAVSANPCIEQDRLTKTVSGALSTTASGKILDLRHGEIRFASSLRRDASYSQFADGISGLKATGNFGSTAASASISIPIQVPRLPVVGQLGNVEVLPAIDYNAADRIGGGFGKSIAVAWSLTPSLTFNSSLGVRVAPPGNVQSSLPRQTVFDVPLFDYKANAIIPVDLIVGGAQLERQSFTDKVFSIRYNTIVNRVNGGMTLGFNQSTISKPILALREPSHLLEQALPQRFLRDTSGTLLRVDARPFNALEQTASSLSASVNLAGSGRDASFLWDLTLMGQRQLQDKLLIAQGSADIDLLKNPLSISAGIGGRQRWNAQASCRSRVLGINLAMDYSSAVRSTSSGEPRSSLYTAPMYRIDGSIFFQPARSGTATKWRLEVSVKNVFNRRPLVKTSTANTITRLDSRLLDPLGRTVIFMFRLPIT